MKQKKRNVGSVRSRAELLSLQRSFAGAIRRPLRKDDTMLSWKDTAAMIAPSRHLSPHSRLELYAQQYWWRLEDSFDEDFVTLARVLSAKEYQTLRERYLQACHSKSFSLRNLGDRLPGFIRKKAKVPPRRAALAYDCACFDWARIVAFDALQHDPLNPEDLLAPKFLNRKIFLQPHVQLLSLQYPVDSVVKQEREKGQERASNTVVRRKRKGSATKPMTVPKQPVELVVHRHQEKVYMKRVSPLCRRMLSMFQKGCSIASLVQKVKITTPSQTLDMQKALQEWVSLGWLYICN